MKIIQNYSINIFRKDKKNKKLKKLYFILLLFLGIFSFSQTLGSKLDKKTLALGEVGTFRIDISGLGGKNVQIAPKNELLPFHFEEIKDSTSIVQDYYSRTIEFAVFEEGKFTIPALEVKIGGELFHTIPYEVEVVNTANKGDEINDIMPNKGVKLQVQDYWDLYKWYIIAALLVLVLILLIIFLRKYFKKRKNSPVVMTNQTLKELEALKKKKFIETGNFRSFYVELIDITRNFITKQYHIPADVLLTDDLIEVMKKSNSISTSNEKIVEEIFLRGDLVKFAKTFPNQQMMETDFGNIIDFVKRSSKDLEAEQLRTGV